MMPLPAYRLFFGLIIALWCYVPSAALHAATQEKTARDFVTKLGNDVLTVVGNTSLSATRREAELVRIFSDVADVAWIGKFVLGKYVRQISGEQRARYDRLYPEFLLHGYATRFNEYQRQSDTGFTVTGSHPISDKEYQVDSVILRGGGQPPVTVSYRVRYEKNRFWLFDVIIEGVSQLATQRSDFNALISRHGIDYLLDRLEQKVAALSSSPAAP